MKKALAILSFLVLLPMAAGAATYTATLTGDAVVPGPGDDGGSGLAVLDLQGTTLTYTILVSGVPDVTTAHIHEGAAGTSGGVVVDLSATFVNGTATNTVSVDAGTASAMQADPAGYYVQVHSDEFGDGAVRGQLEAGTSGGTTTLYFPVAAAISGVGDTFFKTDGRFVNRTGRTADLTIDYYAEGAAGHSAPTASGTATIAPGAQLVVNDAVAALFGVTNGKGAMVITSDQPISGDMRIYNDQVAAGDGTFGQFVRGLPMSAAYDSGVLPFLSNRPQSTGMDYRSNIGWFNPNASAVNVTFRGYDSDGTLLGEVSRSVNGYAQQQVNVASLWPALSDYGDFYVTFTADSGVFVYASVVDNVNGDALYVPAVDMN